MKKYMMYSVLITLLISSGICVSVWGKRNDFQLEFNKISNSAEDTIGDISTIKDLKYQFYIGEVGNQSTHLWEVNAIGENFHAKSINDNDLLYKKWVNSSYKVEDTGVIVYMKNDRAVMDENENSKLYRFANQGSYSDSSSSLDFDIAYYQGYENNKLKIASSKTFQLISDKKEQGEYYFEFDINEVYPFKTMSINNYGTQKIKNNEYFFISARNFNFDVSKYSFSSNPAGIYKVDNKTKGFKKILDIDMKHENIISMKAQKEHLVCLTQKENDVYLRVYDTEGHILHEQIVYQGFDKINTASLSIDRDYMIVNIIEKFNVVNKQISTVYKLDKKIQKIQTFQEKTTDWDSDDSRNNRYIRVGIDYNMHYKYQDGKLFIVKQGYSRFSMSVYDKNKCLYNSYLVADYQKDSKLALDDLFSYSTQTPLAAFLNTSERILLEFDWK